MILIPVRKDDIAIGKPLPWSLYGRNNELVHKHGHVVETSQQLEALLNNGTLRDSGWRSEPFEPCQELVGVSKRSPKTANEFVARVEEIRFLIGDPIQLESPQEGGSAVNYVKLIGYLKGKSILVTSPVADGKNRPMREGQQLIVRAFSSTSAYVFPASVIGVAGTPFPHLHLTYPNSARGVAVRKDCRVETSITAAVHCSRQHRGNVCAAATIANLSIGGALLSSKTRLGIKGDKVALKFRIRLRETESCLAIEALIRTFGGSGASGHETPTFRHGVQFVNLQEQDAVILTAYVYQAMLEESAVPRTK